jgi:hypothetical protein
MIYMIPAVVLLVLGALMSVVFIVSKVTNYSLKTIIFKTIASLFFVALGIYCAVIAPGPVPFKVWLVLGLFFGMLGDTLLGFKYITTKTKNIWILAGMFAFAFGHISYIVALFVGYYVPGNGWFIALPFITAVVLSSIYMVISRRVGITFGKLLPFGLFYLFCLTSMVSTSLYMNVLSGFSHLNLVLFFIGAIFFAASDSMLTGAYFKAGKRSKPYMAIYSVFYYIAQFLIAFSLFFLA